MRLVDHFIQLPAGEPISPFFPKCWTVPLRPGCLCCKLLCYCKWHPSKANIYSVSLHISVSVLHLNMLTWFSHSTSSVSDKNTAQQQAETSGVENTICYKIWQRKPCTDTEINDELWCCCLNLNNMLRLINAEKLCWWQNHSCLLAITHSSVENVSQAWENKAQS